MVLAGSGAGRGSGIVSSDMPTSRRTCRRKDVAHRRRAVDTARITVRAFDHALRARWHVACSPPDTTPRAAGAHEGRPMTTSRTLRLALVFTIASALGGCAAERRQDARVTGKRLVAAGFTVEGPNSPESAERLRVLPALTIVPQREDGTTVIGLPTRTSATASTSATRTPTWNTSASGRSRKTLIFLHRAVGAISAAPTEGGT